MALALALARAQALVAVVWIPFSFSQDIFEALAEV